MICRESIYT